MLRSSTTATAAALARRSSSNAQLPILNDGTEDGSGGVPIAPSAAADDTAAVTRVLFDVGDEVSEASQLNETYLWLLVLATAAECITTCFVPNWIFANGSKVNVSATALNFIGPFLDGLTYGYEDLPKTGAPSIACMQFRSSFLGVFTSFSFMVDHAGDLSTGNFFMGPLYICVTILVACASFRAGRSVVQPLLTSRVLRINSIRKAVATSANKYPSLLSCVAAFILMTTLAAAFGPKGFVRDPKDPQFIGALRVADGEELFLGIFMSCSAILLSDFICERLRPKVKVDALGNRIAIIDWGCLLCNFISCVLVCVAYEASKLSPHAIKNNLLVLKFVSSFCGSISCFSAAISHTARMWQAGDQQGALWNLLSHLIVGLLFVPYLNKQETTR